jgi:S-DNA-T family DNA segregation ATPase FtsK/SpoIIIE
VLPPLPEAVAPPPPSLHRADPDHPARAAITLGLLDLPGEQAQYPLGWSPPSDSHLAVIGLPSSGAAGALGHLVAECLATMPDAHLYILDGDFSLGFAAAAAQTGAYVQGHEAARAERVLERIAGAVIDRLAGVPAEAAPILVVLSGWGRWAGTFRSRRYSPAEESLQDIARDGAAAGVHLAVTGERDLTGARFFPQLPNRVFLPLGASSETLSSWPRLPALDPVPGRGLAQGPFSPGGTVQLITRRREPAAAPRPPRLRPFRVDPLPALVAPEALRPSPAEPGRCRIPIGLGGDEPATVCLDLAPGGVFAAVGPPRSGRTGFLNQVQDQAPPGLLTLRPKGPAGEYWRGALVRGPLCTEPARCLLVIDDAEALAPDLHQLLDSAVAAGARAVLAAAPGFLLLQVPLARRARAADQGLVLAPRTPADGEVFGVRLEAGQAVRAGPAGRTPGRAVLLRSGGQEEVQLALNPGKGR